MHELTVVFDLDGTLVDTAPDLVAATNHALSDIALPAVSASVLTPWVSFGARRMIEEGLRHTKSNVSAKEVDRLLALFLGHYEKNIAVHSRPFAGAVEALHYLRSMGARLAVCTNKREGLSRLLLKSLGLHDEFAAIAGRDTYPVSKPHPDHLIGVIREAGGKPSHAIMVGDTKIDIAAATAAGVPSIAVTFGYSDIPAPSLGATTTIDHFDQLVSAITTIRPRPASVTPG
jgi:phosphoglycolate phosphatase